ncbi:peroxiredoxin [Legionella sp. CNM-4043-24]|uniref:peroxiredoxin n=1 Tax=Legionella sp. CNM-4043-24 TaxID=3421646 RepID=UPI00403A894E
MIVGEAVPNVVFSTTSKPEEHLADYRGKWLVLYFYPKDATPGCTVEGRDFRDAHAQFQALNAVVLGVSRDSISSHDNFKCKQEFPFDLISDADESLCQLFDVIKIKSMYGKKMRGIERSTFIINPEGILMHEWRRVRVIGHVDAVLSTLKALQA